MKAGLQEYFLNALSTAINPFVLTLSVVLLHTNCFHTRHQSPLAPTCPMGDHFWSQMEFIPPAALSIPVSVEYEATDYRWDSHLHDYIMAVPSRGSLTWDEICQRVQIETLQYVKDCRSVSETSTMLLWSSQHHGGINTSVHCTWVTREGICPRLRHREGVLTLLAAGFGAGTRWTWLDAGWFGHSLLVLLAAGSAQLVR
jgi:hypothetical protein